MEFQVWNLLTRAGSFAAFGPWKDRKMGAEGVAHPPSREKRDANIYNGGGGEGCNAH